MGVFDQKLEGIPLHYFIIIPINFREKDARISVSRVNELFRYQNINDNA